MILVLPRSGSLFGLSVEVVELVGVCGGLQVDVSGKKRRRIDKDLAK